MRCHLVSSLVSFGVISCVIWCHLLCHLVSSLVSFGVISCVIWCHLLCHLVSSLVSFGVISCVIWCHLLCHLVSSLVSFGVISEMGKREWKKKISDLVVIWCHHDHNDYEVGMRHRLPSLR